MRASIPDARQCGSCGHGPIDHFACSNLDTHQGEEIGGGVRINNACPKCGWRSADISAWPRWNGNLADDAVGSTSFEVDALALSGGASQAVSDEAAARRMHEAEQLRQRQLQDDHALAIRLQATL